MHSTNYASLLSFSHSLTPADPPIAHCSAKSDSPIRIRRPSFGRCTNPPCNLAPLKNAEQEKTPNSFVWPEILRSCVLPPGCGFASLSNKSPGDDLSFACAVPVMRLFEQTSNFRSDHPISFSQVLTGAKRPQDLPCS
jgi:hypothetical protein